MVGRRLVGGRRRHAVARSSGCARAAAPLAACAALVPAVALVPAASAAAPEEPRAAIAASRAGGARVKRCKVFTLVLVRHGRVVRRHGRAVRVKRRRCVTVPAPNCTVRWSKRRRHGHVVYRRHNPVYQANVHCPPATAKTPVAPPGPAPAPSPGSSAPAAGPGNAAVAVYSVSVQGYTFADEDLNGGIPAQAYAPVEEYEQHGYLVRLLTPFPGLNGPAQDEIGLFLGSLVELGPRAGTTQFATNTLMFTAADPGDPSLFDQLPFPYDVGQVSVQGDELLALADVSSLRAAFPSGAKTPEYFVDRSGLISGTIKDVNEGAVSLQFAPDQSSVSGVFELHGGVSLTTPGLIPPSEYGLFGIRGAITGTRVSPPGGDPIYLPPPLPSVARPPGCRTELHLVPGLGDGTLSEQLVTVCS